jgi:hypothetical protein
MLYKEDSGIEDGRYGFLASRLQSSGFNRAREHTGLTVLVKETPKAVPLTCHGHSRPVTHLDFSSVVDDDQYYFISACKGRIFGILRLFWL